jgi:hypothetical protein
MSAGGVARFARDEAAGWSGFGFGQQRAVPFSETGFKTVSKKLF